VNLRLQDISERTAANLPDVLIDLVEIAAYVYAADQATPRGGEGVIDVGARWRRDFHFCIPVRQPAVWSQREIADTLTKALNILSEDSFEFTFQRLVDPPPLNQYLEGAVDRGHVEQVLLFSGGLDSLGGAVQETVVEKRRVALVTHRSTPKMDRPQQELAAALAAHCDGNVPAHVPVWVNKDRALGIEATQRTRSFLFASLGVAVAQMFNLNNLRFYENGITSMNLPISEQLVGARASRTTHPQALNGFGHLFALLLQQDFEIENPFFWKTKADVINLIGSAGCADLIKHTISCIHTHDRTNTHSHCGLCSQCVGRRFAALASNYGQADPPKLYESDLLTGPHDDRQAVTLLESLIRTTRRIGAMSDRQFFTKFGEASRLINHLPGKADDVGTRILDLHRQYSAEVGRVLANGMAEHAAEFNAERLPATCAIALAVPDKYKVDAGSTVSRGTAIEPENGKKRLSPGDQRLYETVGEQLLKDLTNADILRKKALIRSFDPTFDPDAPEGIRARLNRIRKHFQITPSDALRRKPVNPAAN
jgi:7-cyano-7-deazaguanine synthase in queuosine biosynthesis